ncbi:hypothetical protein TOPH_08833 [Tolypocladium ophioglossoides CBS 100239]|uniref:Uncharacterized protein n=1 Tax=Tolypocladium ophioglossoides (strain CBS 100239) TaxID=1163406 RepID=A0A0L0MXG7_TOLOC|nr:hypothetical protein TOPH_08833 [Tolypocladium ophioglossoides CBS 100239]
MQHTRPGRSADTFSTERLRGCSVPDGALDLLNYWEICWNRCLDFVEQTFKIRLESQDDFDQLEKPVSDSSSGRSKTCTRIMMLLSSFRNHINLVAESVRKMEDEWARMYPGKYSGRFGRFDVNTQDTLLENWTKILSHLDQVGGNSTVASRGLSMSSGASRKGEIGFRFRS